MLKHHILRTIASLFAKLQLSRCCRIIFFFKREIAKAKIALVCNKVGLNLHLRDMPIVYHPNKLSIGDNVSIGEWVHINAAGKINIGSNVLISHRVTLASQSHNYKDKSLSNISAPIQICDGAWLGAHVCVLGGVTIGRGCIVGAGAIVTKSLPEMTICVGAPARVIKRRALLNK